MSDRFEMLRRRNNCTWAHHYEVAFFKKIRERADGKLEISDDTDYEKIEELLSRAERERLSKRDLREAVRKHKEEQRKYIDLANAPEKYAVIYADPPWQYTSGDQHGEDEQHTVLSDHYSAMSLQQICALPVRQIAHDNCVLFLWVTSLLLEEAFQIVRSWGFEYKTSMVWDKVKHNVGNYVSVRHELLLICTRGETPKVPKLVDSVYTEERTEHSRKPRYFRDLIDELYPDGRRVELFARGEQPGNWQAWGDEAVVEQIPQSKPQPKTRDLRAKAAGITG
jgi:N6-adenosine-specific RNA methylase IME4